MYLLFNGILSKQFRQQLFNCNKLIIIIFTFIQVILGIQIFMCILRKILFIRNN